MEEKKRDWERRNENRDVIAQAWAGNSHRTFSVSTPQPGGIRDVELHPPSNLLCS